MLIYSLFYPVFIWNLPTIQNSIQPVNPSSGVSDVNINVQDSVSFSVIHDYFGVVLPVYVGDICVRFYNHLWLWSFVFLVLDLIYILFRKDKFEYKQPNN